MMVTAVLVCLAVLLLVLRVVMVNVPSPRALYYLFKLPGPWGLPIVGYILNWMAVPPDGIEKFFKLHFDKYKRIFASTSGGVVMIYLLEPKDIMLVLSDKNNVDKGFEYKVFSTFLGQGLLNAEAEVWRANRRVVDDFFHKKMLEQAVPVFVRQSQRLVDHLMKSAGEAVDVVEDLLGLALDIAVETTAGLGERDEDYTNTFLELVIRGFKLVQERVGKIWKLNPRLYRLTADYHTGLQIKREFDVIYDKLLSKKKKMLEERDEKRDANGLIISEEEKSREPFMHQMLKLKMKNPGLISDSFIKDQTNILLLAGHETCGTSLSFLMAMLALHPDIQERCYDEVMDVVGHGDFNINNTKNLVYLDMVIKENLRLFTPISYLSRTLSTDIVLEDGKVLPRGASVGILPYFVHRNETYFPDAERFDPDRFLPDLVETRHPFSYIPYSQGPRNCIGFKYARIELKVVAAMILRRFKILPVTKREDIKYIITLTLRITEPIECRFVPR